MSANRFHLFLPVSNAVGLLLSVLVLFESGESPTNMSRIVLLTQFIALLSMVTNLIALEVILSSRFFP
jgi:hypothetical protein